MPANKQQIVTENSGQKSWILKGLILLLLLSVTIIAVLAGGNGSNLATTRKTEPSTELYFSTTSSLPKKVQLGQKVALPAVIANHEGKTTAYTYIVEIAPKKNGKTGAQTELMRGSIELGDQSNADLPIDFSAPTEIGDYDVTVRLGDRDEVIHYTLGVEK